MQKKAGNLGLIVLFIMSIMLVIALGTGLVMTMGTKNNLQEENKKLKNDISTLETDLETMKKSINELNDVMKRINTTLTSSTSNTNTTSNSSKSKDEIVKEAYSKKLESKSNMDEEHKLKEYKIEKVEVLDDAKTQELKNNFADYKEINGIFAIVTYSVKPERTVSWLAGNGEPTAHPDFLHIILRYDRTIVSEYTG